MVSKKTESWTALTVIVTLMLITVFGFLAWMEMALQALVLMAIDQNNIEPFILSLVALMAEMALLMIGFHVLNIIHARGIKSPLAVNGGH